MQQPQIIFPVIRKNVPRYLRRDLYHDLLTLGWRKTLLLFILTLFSLNALFATLYWLDSESLSNSDGSWWTAFFFSVQTLGTIGYGHWSPVSTFAHILVTFESGVGLILVAIMAGFFFAKFSRPFSKVEFTKKLVVTPFDGKPTLIFRMINIRKNQMLDATIQLTLMHAANSIEGHSMRRFVDLKLIRSKVPVLTMSMNLMHVIDESSPLYDCYKGAKDPSVEILVSAIGTDGTFGQSIHANYLYSYADIIWDNQFADMVEVMPNGTRIVDYSKFNQLKS